MTSEKWLFILIALLIFNYIFSSILSYINDKNWNDSIPDSLKDFYSKEKYIKAKNYKKETGKLGFFSSSLSFLITFLLLYFVIYGFVLDYLP